MSKENHKAVVAEKHESVETVALATEEIIEREVENVKKCGSCISKDVRWLFHCCIKTWSCTLNLGECCCGGLAAGCNFCGGMAHSCKNCMEELDCDEK